MSFWSRSIAFSDSNILTPCTDSSGNTIILKQSFNNPRLYRLEKNILKDIPSPFNLRKHAHKADAHVMLFKALHKNGQRYNIAYSPYYGTLATFVWPSDLASPLVSTPTLTNVTAAHKRGPQTQHQYVAYSLARDSLYVLCPDVHARAYELYSIDARGVTSRTNGFPDNGINNQRNGHLFVLDNYIGFVYADVRTTTRVDITLRFFNLDTCIWHPEITNILNFQTRAGLTEQIKWSVHRKGDGILRINLIRATKPNQKILTHCKVFDEHFVHLLIPTLPCTDVEFYTHENPNYHSLQGSYTDNLIINTINFAGKEGSNIYFGKMYSDGFWEKYPLKLEGASVKKVKQTLSSLYSVLLREGGILSPFNKKIEVEVILNTKTLEILRKELGVPVQNHKNKIRLEEFGSEGKTVIVTFCTKDHISGEHAYFVQRQVWENVFIKKENPSPYTDKYRILDILRYAKVVKCHNK